MKRTGEVVEILEAFDLTGSLRDAARLAGCSPMTVARYVRLRETGKLDVVRYARRDQLVDEYLAKVEEWVERSHGRVRADVVHDKLGALGFGGSERTTRRAVAHARRAYDAGHRRVYRPWIPEPGMWLQFDWGHGPRIAGRESMLWCAWLAWSRFRVVIPTWDRTLPTVVACLDETLRRFGGSPTYALTDNERTVTIDRIAGIGVRHPEIVAAGRHYGLQITACVPFDPESKGGSEATVRVAKADLVPTEANLLPAYGSFAELRAACDAFCETVNGRVHRETKEAPANRLAAERARLHPIPAEAHTVAFGVTRVVDDDGTLRFGSARYSVPHQLAGERVWVRNRRRRARRHVRLSRWRPRGRSSSAHHAWQSADRSEPLSAAHHRSAPSATQARESRRASIPRARVWRRALARPRRGIRERSHQNQDPPRDRACHARRAGPGRSCSRSRRRGRPLRRR